MCVCVCVCVCVYAYACVLVSSGWCVLCVSSCSTDGSGTSGGDENKMSSSPQSMAQAIKVHDVISKVMYFA